MKSGHFPHSETKFFPPDWLEHEDKISAVCEASGICCCGSPEVGALLLEVLRFCALGDEKFDKEKFPRGCYRDLTWELAAKILDSADLIEHGTGIGWPWITKGGQLLLSEIEHLPDEARGEKE